MINKKFLKKNNPIKEIVKYRINVLKYKQLLKRI